MTALLKGLTARSAGLCVVTTRESVTDLASFRDSTALEHKTDGCRRRPASRRSKRSSSEGPPHPRLLCALAGDDDGARADLDEAWEIAARGPMPLFQADVHLHRARLFRDRDALAEARRLIEKHGYGRRLDVLADAEAWAEGWGARLSGVSPAVSRSPARRSRG